MGISHTSPGAIRRVSDQLTEAQSLEIVDTLTRLYCNAQDRLHRSCRQWGSLYIHLVLFSIFQIMSVLVVARKEELHIKGFEGILADGYPLYALMMMIFH